MYLKRLTLTGFKSFARHTSLEFANPITAIVGPNGAGKSNIGEAVRFVLGEQSMKTLRGKRGEDLIFNGTKQIPRQNRASVSIVFDNGKKVFPVDFEEVELKRVVYRDGTSNYFINNTQTRLKDIIELLSSVHIGASSHHIIGQGESDRILNASLKDRRSMIEDSLGLKIYQYKRIESEKRLLKTQENLTHIQALQKEIEPHLKFLEKQVEKIRYADALRVKLKALYLDFLVKEKTYLQFAEKKIQSEKTLIGEELSGVEEDIKQQKKLMNVGEEREDDTNAVRDVEQALNALRQTRESLSRELGKIEGMLEYKKRSTKDIGSGFDNESAVTIPRKVFEEMRGKIENQFQYAEGSHELHTLREIFRRLKEELRIFFETFLGEKIKIDTRESEEQELQSLEREKERIENERKELEAKEQTLFKQYQNKKEEFEKDRGVWRTTERRLLELYNHRTELVTKLELIKVREERFDEDERRFTYEHKEAEHFLGKEVALHELNALTVDDQVIVMREEQEKNRKEIERMKIKIEDVGSGGADILKEYNEVYERDTFLKNEIEDLGKSAGALEDLIAELGQKINTEFQNGIKMINVEFQSLFSQMFDGGNASLKIKTTSRGRKGKKEDQFEENPPSSGEISEDEDEDETEEGIEIVVSLPKKRIRGLSMLSGGERALSSIALIFAMIQVNPPPFLILDETDAALDESNSRKYGLLLENLSPKTQFIVITHNRATMAKSGILYGVTTGGDGTSRILSVKLQDAVALAEAV